MKKKRKKKREPKPRTSLLCSPSCSPRVGYGGGSVGMARQRGWSVICLDLGTEKSFCGLGFLCEGKSVGGDVKGGARLGEALTVGPYMCV